MFLPERNLSVSARTLQSDAVHGEGTCQLGRHLHAAADERLAKHVLEGLVKLGAVAQLADHWDGVLRGDERGKMYSSILHMNPEHLVMLAMTACT